MKQRLPATSVFRAFAEAGGLVSYGPEQAAVAEALCGNGHEDSPRREAQAIFRSNALTKFELVVNLKAAKALGLTIPDSDPEPGGRGYPLGSEVVLGTRSRRQFAIAHSQMSSLTGARQLFGRRLPQEAQHADQHPARLARVDGLCKRLLAELLAPRVDRYRKMGVAGNRQAQEPEHVDLSRAGLEQIGAAHDVGHAELAVVDGGRQVEGEHPIGAIEHEVAGLVLEIVFLRAEHAVVELHLCAGGEQP